nr:phage integrase N-terminal SAM-like domain-containing protein [uncultured Butyrivibrio sp.]
MNTDDVRSYLSSYQENNGVSKATVDNVRRNLSSFFRYTIILFILSNCYYCSSLHFMVKGTLNLTIHGLM